MARRKALMPTWLKIFLVAFLVTTVLLVWSKANRPERIVTAPASSVATISAEQRTPATVTKVIDGDTVQVSIEGEIEIVRLIGIDAPESVDPKKPVQCFAVEASNKAKELLTNQSVFLEADPTQGDEDIYHRKLRYIFLPDGTNFNELMVAEGYAREYSYYGKQYKYRERIKEAQLGSKTKKKGFWADGICT